MKLYLLVHNLQELFQPVEIAERLWIVPEWTSPPVCIKHSILFNNFILLTKPLHPFGYSCYCFALVDITKSGLRVLNLQNMNLPLSVSAYIYKGIYKVMCGLK